MKDSQCDWGPCSTSECRAQGPECWQTNLIDIVLLTAVHCGGGYSLSMGPKWEMNGTWPSEGRLNLI